MESKKDLLALFSRNEHSSIPVYLLKKWNVILDKKTTTQTGKTISVVQKYHFKRPSNEGNYKII